METVVTARFVIVPICDSVPICDWKCPDLWQLSRFVIKSVAICDNIKICIFTTCFDSICLDMLFIGGLNFLSVLIWWQQRLHHVILDFCGHAFNAKMAHHSQTLIEVRSVQKYIPNYCQHIFCVIRLVPEVVDYILHMYSNKMMRKKR